MTTNTHTHDMDAIIPGTNWTWGDAANEAFERETGIPLTDDGRIDKRRLREQRLFGPNARPIEVDDTAPGDDAFGGDWHHVLDEEGRIDKAATRELRIFGNRVAA